MNKPNRIQAGLLCMGVAINLTAQEYTTAPGASDNIVPPTPEWVAKITELAPAKATVQPGAPRWILLFSLATGFKHKVIPHASEVVKVLGTKSGAYEVVESNDIEMFAAEKLKTFDAVVLNNTCPKREYRNMFLDVLADTPEVERNKRAAELEQSLLDFVRTGKGLVALHGAIAVQNNSPEFSEMMGGSFDFHPKRQTVTLDLVDPAHPLAAGFHGKGFIHDDEPYLFKNAYAKKNFRPLLEMNVGKLDEQTRKNPQVAGEVRYVAWIKGYGEGRVFYCGPSHQPESYETAAMLQFVLDGIQYALGDLPCDDSPIK
ncbi:MAG: ThuA domain-containing protein [Verrucomicrobia bacterium]|nr:ThuA domain-containing protein [Verrucomicrobiota bacterium]